jgi:hypothetical protein
MIARKRGGINDERGTMNDEAKGGNPEVRSQNGNAPTLFLLAPGF